MATESNVEPIGTGQEGAGTPAGVEVEVNIEKKTPGGTVGILGWILASLGLRPYLHFSDSYSLAYGSLGAVVILLTWFYISGLMLLVGAEINSEIGAAADEKQLGALSPISPAS